MKETAASTRGISPSHGLFNLPLGTTDNWTRFDLHPAVGSKQVCLHQRRIQKGQNDEVFTVQVVKYLKSQIDMNPKYTDDCTVKPWN